MLSHDCRRLLDRDPDIGRFRKSERQVRVVLILGSFIINEVNARLLPNSTARCGTFMIYYDRMEITAPFDHYRMVIQNG